MRIGLVSLYSWRPHVEHMYFLADLLRNDGHDVEFLTCDADLPACYTREIRNIRPGWQECLLCRAGGLRSYSSSNVSSIGDYAAPNIKLPESAKDWALSSASTLGRFESDSDFASEPFWEIALRLQPAAEKAYKAANHWIKSKRLEGLLVFNGRMDATRAIFEAGVGIGIPVLTLERSWFGDGLQILPQENCLGLRSINRMVSEWAGKPLTAGQASLAASHIAARFLKLNHKEWRAYNLNSIDEPWPVVGGTRKILLIPGSRNEFWGHPDCVSDWDHPVDAYDALMQHFGLQPKDLLLRCHPNWGENIGKADGRLVEEYYVDWANSRGVGVVPSTSSMSTLKLIDQADAIVLASGTAALEAGALGKQIIGISPSHYQESGIREDAGNLQKLKSLTLRVDMPASQAEQVAADVRRKTLRFTHAIAYRVPQYVEYVKCDTTTSYLYKKGANAERLISMLKTGLLTADDTTFADDTTEEDQILALIQDRLWGDLICAPSTEHDYRKMSRRSIYKGVDWIRAKMRHGDR